MPLVSNQYLDQVADLGIARRRLQALQDTPRRLLQRVKLLDPPDRSLVELHLAGASVHCAGRALGMSSGQAWRRLKRVMQRVRNPLVDALCDEQCLLPVEHRYIGIEHFLQGRSARLIAEKHQMQERHVLAIVSFIKVWHAAGNTHPRRPAASARARRRSETVALDDD